jgi:hypothetical protein
MNSEDIIKLIRYFNDTVSDIKNNQSLSKKKEDVFIDLFAIRLSDIEDRIEELSIKYSENEYSYIESINKMNDNLKRLDLDIQNNNENIKKILNDFLNNL